MRHRRHPINTTSARRRTAWARYQFSLSNAAAGTFTAVDLLSNYKTDGGTTEGCTIARIHHKMTVSTTIAAADQVNWGILRGQNSDVGVSPAGTPSILADPYEDWMWWEVHDADHLSNLEPGAANVIIRDIRSKRKIPQLQMALLFILGPQTITTLPLTVKVSGSVLLMLP